MKNIKNFIKNNYKDIIYVLIILLANIVFINKKITDNKLALIMVCLVNVAMILVYYFIIRKNENIKLEKLYLLIIIPIGLLFLLVFPILHVPDEGNHFMRINEIAEGKLFSKIDKKKNMQGTYLDSNLSNFRAMEENYNYETNFKLIKYTNSSTKKFYSFANTALYSFACYLPQTIGLLFGKILHLPILIQAYLARLFNFIVFSILSYFALKLLPLKKNVFAIILLSPLVIQEAISMAPDALTIGLSAFLISYVLYLKSKKEEKLQKKNIIVLTLSSIVLSLCKIIYLPICFIILLIPKEKFKSVKKKYLILLSIILSAVIINLLWLSYSSKMLPTGDNINSSLQLHNIINNPFNYFKVFCRTISSESIGYVLNSFGAALGWYDIILSKIYLLPILLIFAGYTLFDNKKTNVKITTIEKIFAIAIFVGITILMGTSLYLQWTPVGESTIYGIQGRYFLPLYFLLGMIFTKYTISPKINFDNRKIYLYIFALDLYAASMIFIEKL